MSLPRIHDCVLSLPITMIEKLVLLGLIRNGDFFTGADSHPGNDTLQFYTSASDRSVRRAIVILLKKSFIELQAPGRQHMPPTYRVRFDKIRAAAARIDTLRARGRMVEPGAQRSFLRAVKRDEES